MTLSELYSAMSNKTVSDVVDVLSRNLERMVKVNQESANKIVDKLGESDNLDQLVAVFETLMTGKTDGKGSQFIYKGKGGL